MSRDLFRSGCCALAQSTLMQLHYCRNRSTICAGLDKGTEMTSSELKVLVVDDEDMIRTMVSAILRRHGIRDVVGVRDGIECVESALALAPDVILMDLHLPRVNGWDALIQLRANPQTAHIPVVAFSVDSGPEVVDAALTAGFNDFLPKPVHPQELLSRLLVFATPS
jgi:CheY-like chemotaxis protein